MSKIELNKLYNSLLITETGDEWTGFNNFSGSDVELFLKDKLEDAIVDIAYHNTLVDPVTGATTSNVLEGINAFGKPVCRTRVINADPTYTLKAEFESVKIGSNTYNQTDTYDTIQVGFSNNLSVTTIINYELFGNLAGNTYNETSAQSVTFKWFNDRFGEIEDKTLRTVTRTITPNKGVSVNLTDMFKDPFSTRYLGMVARVPNGKEDLVHIFNTPFTLRQLKLEYKGGSIITTPILPKLSLNGTLDESLSNYRIRYYIDGVSNSGFITLKDEMQADSFNLDLSEKNLSEGAHTICLVAEYTNANFQLTSNYTEIGFIYQADKTSLTSAVATITNVPNSISNCNLSKFFTIITTSYISGVIDIVAVKSSKRPNVSNITTVEQARASEYLFQDVTLELLNTDKGDPVDYTSYIEVPSSGNTEEYLKIIIRTGGVDKELGFFTYANNQVGFSTIRTITIINPTNDEYAQQLQYTKGEILNFSQISNGNFFTDLNSNLDSSDGLQLEKVMNGTNLVTMNTFKVSPTSGVFAQPKPLVTSTGSSLKDSAFSIEMLFKTYGISDLEDPIMTIGNITLCPKHLFINYPEEDTSSSCIIKASRADFRKEVLQHVVITYDPYYLPNTYDTIYNMLYANGNVNYKDATTYPCLKVYVNGTINRVISVSSDTIGKNGTFNLQIHPSNASINYYIFRTYEQALSYEQVKKNFISSLSYLTDKQAYFADNNILYESKDFTAAELNDKQHLLGTISLGKCINKFNSVGNPTSYKDRKVLLVALAEGTLPPFYGNRKNDEPKAAFLVHYPELATEAGYVPSEYSGVLNGGKVKAQGSSAKKYMIHNTSYSKFNFVTEAEAKMPGSDIEIEKLVGKVNYASSMQSHKQGATKLFHDAYMASDINTDWMNNGRKAVLEDDFFYFFVNVPKDDLATITWDYFKQEDGTYNFEKCYFLGFQTWGSAKGDKPTSGYSAATPHYLMLEGADNDNSSANFKTPWASLQIWGNYNKNKWSNADSTFIENPPSDLKTYTDGKNYYHQFAGGVKNSSTGFWTPNYFDGLLINDETIVFDPGTDEATSSDKRADAWDVDFGCTEGDSYYEKGENPNDPNGENLFFVFEEKALPSLKRFAEFYNLVYTFDFSSLIFIPSGETIDGNSMIINGQSAYQYKLIFGDGCTITYKDGTETHPNVGDIYRWEKAWLSSIAPNHAAKWVPAGLYHNGSNWENLNITDICNWYSSATHGKTGEYPEEYEFFAKPEYDVYRATTGYGNKYALQQGYSNFTGDSEYDLLVYKECMAEAFQIAMYEYLDVADASYHQAFIKLVAGTDNRAKNTYFQIVGPIYTDKTEINGKKVSLVSITDGEKKGTVGYFDADLFYPVTIANNTATLNETPYVLEGVSTKKCYCIDTKNGDFKIRLYADDLDTIFKTDNNGQQVKPYYLLEPPYNKDLESLWGDMHSGLFYNYDLKFVDDIKDKLAKLLEFSTGSQWPDEEGTKFNEYFFSVQKNIPSIAYNHQSEIYYESPQVLWRNGSATALYTELATTSSWKDFNNNKVKNPVSLSHGSCLEAETEYLRDRVLMLSTYTNVAKKTTDTNIEFRSDSSGTEGDEFMLETDYTSFIQYLYPTLRTDFTVVTTKPNTKTLQYDPLLDRMKYVSDEVYSPHYITSGITVPDGVIGMQESIATSSLTITTYWTNTDLYRTVWIKSGSMAFNKPLNFPNANTVIIQDPNYSLLMPETQPWNVVDNLRSVEHLILQEANISSSCLDFTGCNRLKTLVLGTTLDKLKDSPEGTPVEEIDWYAVKFEDVLDPTKFVKVKAAGASTGFKQVILPKASKVEQVILPKWVEVVNISYYPELKRFEFNDGTQLRNLTIDGRNDNETIEYILSNFVGTYTEMLELSNIPDNFWLSEDACRKLTQVKNIKAVGTINIGDVGNPQAIDWTTKKMLVETFGDIVNGDLRFTYKHVSISANDITGNNAGNIESSGLAPVQLSIKGNAIQIAANKKHLKITYKITDYNATTVPNTNDIKFEDEYTPHLTIKEGLKGKYDITTTVYYEGSSVPVTIKTTITVGFYAPSPGDFAYANGSFSPVCDLSQGLVGVVFYSKLISYSNGKAVYDVRVLSADYSSTDVPMAPAKYAFDFTTSNTLRKKQRAYSALLTDLGLSPDSYYADVVLKRNDGTPNGTIYYNTTSEGVALHEYKFKDTNELDNQMMYIQRAHNFLHKLKGKPGLSITSLEADGFTKPTVAGKNNFEKALQEMTQVSYLDIGTSTYTTADCGNFLYALYPGFLKALYYSPNKSLIGKGEEYFSVGNWYIPTAKEMELLIYYRINSAITNTGSTELDWNEVVASKQDVSGQGLNIFKQDAFNNIKFLSDKNSQITANSTGEGSGYAYGLMSYDPNPRWHNDRQEYYGQDCGRDENHNISPICRIELVEP